MPFRTTEVKSAPEATPVALWTMILASLAVGAIAGFGAVAFRGMIAAVHNLLFLGRFSFDYNADLHTAASPWGAWIVGVPVLGAIGVAFLVKTFAPEAKGHGVPEVMSAVYHRNGVIRPVVAAVKAIASALSIGSGGSVGREGPIIQIGSAFGSTIGQIIAMPARQRAILIAAGGGGGIAATFNTPIGGIVFALELLLPSASPLGMLCVALASVTATCIGRSYFGVFPSFNVAAIASVEGAGPALSVLPVFVGFGAIIGLMAWLTTRSIYWFEDFFDRMPGNYYTRHMSGMLVVGLLMYGFMTFSSPWAGQPNHYYVQGVGYATIMDILRGELTAVTFLLVLAVGKLLATCLTLGSGASGGVFSPSMFIGATLGAACSAALMGAFPGLPLNPVHFAVAGMAAMVGGTTGAAVTAIVMTFEMTRDYTVILPVILTVTVAVAIRHQLSRGTIYTLKLLRRGEVVPQGLQAFMGEQRCRHVMSPAFRAVSASEARNDAGIRAAVRDAIVVVVTGDDGEVSGVIRAVSSDGSLPTVARDYVVASPEEFYNDALCRMQEAGAEVIVVRDAAASPGRVKVQGVIGPREISGTVAAMAKLTG